MQFCNLRALIQTKGNNPAYDHVVYQVRGQKVRKSLAGVSENTCGFLSSYLLKDLASVFFNRLISISEIKLWLNLKQKYTVENRESLAGLVCMLNPSSIFPFILCNFMCRQKKNKTKDICYTRCSCNDIQHYRLS